MAKKNPFDQPPPPEPYRPDANIQNADWPKRTPDYDAFTGKLIQPKVVKPTK